MFLLESGTGWGNPILFEPNPTRGSGRAGLHSVFFIARQFGFKCFGFEVGFDSFKSGRIGVKFYHSESGRIEKFHVRF